MLDMHVDYSKLEELLTNMPHIETVRSMNSIDQASENALALARAFTGRSRALILADPGTIESSQKNAEAASKVIPSGNRAELCNAIANSAERIAAIIVKPVTKNQASMHYYYHKARELASAEGAVLIWDELAGIFDPSNEYARMSKRTLPDLTCFTVLNENEHAWLGGSKIYFKELHNVK